MITDKHLAIIKAALTYFDEEFAAHGEAFKSYLAEADRKLRIVSEDFRETRERISEVTLRQVMFDTETNRLAMKNHFDTKDCINRSTPAKQIHYVALLIPKRLLPDGFRVLILTQSPSISSEIVNSNVSAIFSMFRSAKFRSPRSMPPT